MVLGRGDDEGLFDRCGDIDEDVLDVALIELKEEALNVILDVTLLEIAAEALSVEVADSDAVTLAEKVGNAVSEDNKVAMLESNSAADDDILDVADELGVDDTLATAKVVTDDVICIDKENSGVALTLSDIKVDLLA